MSYLVQARLVFAAPTTASRLTTLFVAVVLLSFSTHAEAINWTLSDVTFDGGGTATGSFIFDEPSSLSEWSISSVPGGGLDPFTYDDPGLIGSAGPRSLLACGDNQNRFRCISFFLLAPMTNAGGAVTIDPGSSEEFEFNSGFTSRGIVSGCFTTTGSCAAVPEPSTLLLLGSGLVGVAAALGRRSRHRV